LNHRSDSRLSNLEPPRWRFSLCRTASLSRIICTIFGNKIETGFCGSAALQNSVAAACRLQPITVYALRKRARRRHACHYSGQRWNALSSTRWSGSCAFCDRWHRLRRSRSTFGSERARCCRGRCSEPSGRHRPDRDHRSRLQLITRLRSPQRPSTWPASSCQLPAIGYQLSTLTALAAE
jgi:hypothetical protein